MKSFLRRHFNSPILRFIQFIGERYKIKVFPDKLFLTLLYKHKIGKSLDLRNPLTFNEKIQWLKLFDQNNKYTIMADKYAVKEYALQVLGENLSVPTIGVYKRFDDINLEILPNSFVLKCTHDWNSVIICKNKELLDVPTAKKNLCNALNKNHYYRSLEWSYKHILPQIIIEPFLSDEKGNPPIDYRVYCFSGEPFMIHLTLDKFNNRKVVFLNKEWEHLPIEREGLTKSDIIIEKPKLLDKMLATASKLSKDIPFLRVDFYIVGERLYLGECTFYPGEGLREFYPYEWNLKLGSMINISKIK